VRADPVQGGFVVASCRYDDNDDQQGVVVKLDSSLAVQWSKDYGLASGADQIFDIVVDR
jgi:hypothetical protein